MLLRTHFVLHPLVLHSSVLMQISSMCYKAICIHCSTTFLLVALAMEVSATLGVPLMQLNFSLKKEKTFSHLN